MKQKKLSTAERHSIIELLRLGHSESRIARAIGCTRFRVKQVVIDARMEKVEPGDELWDTWNGRVNEILTIANTSSGSVVNRVAERFGETWNDTDLWLRRLGLQELLEPRVSMKVNVPRHLALGAERMSADRGQKPADFLGRLLSDRLEEMGVTK